MLKSQGFKASQLVEFFQPIADLEGMSVSYVYKDETGHEQVYNHRSDDVGYENPLSRAIKEKKIAKVKALKYALNEEGRSWIKSTTWR